MGDKSKERTVGNEQKKCGNAWQMLNSNKNMILNIHPIFIEYNHDVLDCNALNFLTENGYFSIHVSIVIYKDEDPVFEKPFFECDKQENGRYVDIKAVNVFEKMVCFLLDDFYMDCSSVEVNITSGVDEKLIDFLVNELFLGDIISYSESMKKFRIKQTRFRQIE